jgi:uncharacterized damage-inducible protein DinB
MDPELEHYAQAFERMHTEAAAAVAGLTAAGLNWRPLAGDESTNSLAVTLTHLAGSERYWVGEVAGERPAHRDREAEFRASATSGADLQALLDEAAKVIRETLSSLPPEKLGETVTVPGRDGGRTVSKRWAVVHALEHVAVHVGHMQLTRQLWEAQGRP